MRRIGLVLVFSAFVGCGDDDGPAETDLGPGVTDLGGGSSDSGPPMDDAGPWTDAALADDAGGGEVDAGELPVCGTPPVFAIDVVAPGECPAFTACGGDIVGIWDFAGGCIEVDLSAIEACAGATITRKEGSGRGCVDFDGAFARRVGEATVEVDSHFPPGFCTAGGCMALQSTLQANGVNATCADATDGGCDCMASTTTNIEHAAAYTIESNTIVSGAKRWDYCVSGSTLSYTDVSVGMREPGIYDLTKR